MGRRNFDVTQRKAEILIAALFLLASATLFAEEEPKTSRSLTQFGAMITWGEDSGFSASNWGLSLRTFRYFDGDEPDGFYYSLLGAAIVHYIGDAPAADLRILGTGWRGNPFKALGFESPFDFSLDLGLAPTLELRFESDDFELDAISVALGGTLGLYFPIGDRGDLGFSWEPVFDLHAYRWGEGDFTDTTYSDFVVYWVIKSAKETRKIRWNP